MTQTRPGLETDKSAPITPTFLSEVRGANKEARTLIDTGYMEPADGG